MIEMDEPLLYCPKCTDEVITCEKCGFEWWIPAVYTMPQKQRQFDGIEWH